MVLPAGERRGEEHRGVRRFLEGRRGEAVSVDATYLARAVELASRAIADAAPNPPVGCVLVRDGVTLGEGWHRRRGEAHAEVEALRDARTRGNDARGATAYVSLEPCNHHGRTPPCTNALLEAGVARVVAGALDPNPKTAASGVARLRENGVAVDVLDDTASRALIERFRWTIAHDRPYVTLKMAMSLDGYVSAHRGEQDWLTGPLARERVRDLRADHDAVMVGAGTIRVDDPLLTVRPHRSRRKPYVRVVVCERDPISPESAVLRTVDDAPLGAYAPTIVLAPGAARDRFAALEGRADVVYAGAPDAATLDLEAALVALRERGIASVLCEGGPTLAGRLLAGNLVQRLVWLIAPRLLRGDDAVPVLAGADVAAVNGWRFDRSERLGDDMLLSADLTTCSPA
ncbi:MAG TPA: bifunctional diaminohydroxyphosphoribosylaminopyrimidine deaminase/5-amino-6-(5-phosphoribosylamino)uracil reductase RibD [Candidatus Baltobacteraceae bacterium]|nr:bifunctional diaminohydroxyphosphoribosylaminopyrimidine deaminase/5-amino-6-(5-phosphoribosylamino)uracil reductase RibD [Candidatus Baltobacteraceae bacterium]